MTVTILDTPSLGDRSYVLSDGEAAIAVDPQRDIERVEAVLDELAVDLTHVVETHVHNDYVTGGFALAKALGAEYVLPSGESAAFGHSTAAEGWSVTVGQLRLLGLHTPGHTPTHMAYLGFLADRPVGLFSGGSMLYGAVGRTDLIAEEMTRKLSLAQHASVRRLADAVDGPVPVYPTHGFGSHCSSGTAEIHRSGTIDEELARNPALLETDPEAFADALMAGFGPYPSYYRYMAPANLAGPDAITPHLPPLLEPERVRQYLTDGAWVVDLRPRGAFAAAHLPGSVNVELRNDLPTYLGWVHEWDKPLVLLAHTEADVREAQVLLGRIGLDRPSGALVGPVERLAEVAPLTSMPRVHWQRVNHDRGDAVVLDVRDLDEWESGHHSAAIHIPFHDVPERVVELPEDRPVWVYCATGNRAAVAASILKGTGREVALIDDFCLPGDIPG